MTQTHEFLPGHGTSLVRFGMTPDEVAKALGPIRKSRRNKKDHLVEYRDDGSRVEYSQSEGVLEMSFAKPTRLMLGTTDLLAGNPVELLMTLDDEPMEEVGFLMFFKIGLAMTGLHDGKKSQEAITLFRDGTWPRHDAKPYKPSA